jgi:hypothetical protein
MEPAMNHLNQLIKDYGDQVGLDELALPDHGSISLDFEDGIQIHLDQLDEKLVMYSQVGLVEEGNHPKFEMLLSANLMWRDTDGATLSLDPYSRAAILAQTHTAHELDTVHTLVATLDKFCHLSQIWRDALR